MAPGMGEEVAETQPVAASPSHEAASEISSLPDEPGLTQDTSKLIDEMKEEIKRSQAETRAGLAALLLLPLGLGWRRRKQ